MDAVTVKAPATSANLGSGFDVCGIALERPFDIITIKKAERTTISNIGRFIALDHPEESVFGAVIKKLRSDFGFKDNFEIVIEKQIKHKGGIGCEPASADSVAGVRKLARKGVITEDESVACILTGNLLKDPEATVNYHLGKLQGIRGRYANFPEVIEPSVGELRKHL